MNPTIEEIKREIEKNLTFSPERGGLVPYKIMADALNQYVADLATAYLSQKSILEKNLKQIVIDCQVIGIRVSIDSWEEDYKITPEFTSRLTESVLSSIEDGTIYTDKKLVRVSLATKPIVVDKTLSSAEETSRFMDGPLMLIVAEAIATSAVWTRGWIDSTDYKGTELDKDIWGFLS